MRKLGLLLTLLLSFIIVNKASAATTTISNPAVWYSRWWTSRATVPTISSDTGELKQIPFDVLISPDAFLIGNDNWFSLQNNTILELTTFSGSFSYDFGAPQGGPLTNCHITIRLTTGAAVNPDCRIDENTVGPNGGSITYKFSGSLPTNTGIARVDFNIGELNCTDAYACALPLSAGRVRLKSFNMTIISENSASTTQILQKIDGVSSDLTIISDKLDTIISLLEDMDGMSAEDMEEAIENARESEKEEYEDQQEDVDAGADDAGEQADQATSNLIDTAGTIIGAIRDTPATNCNIRIQRGGFDTGNINLCNVPQGIRTMIGAIIAIPVTIAALHIVYSFLYTYLVFVRKEQD